MLRTRQVLSTSGYVPRRCCHRSFKSLSESLPRNAPIDVHPEVEDALVNNKPVVALESTIITHGMPYPTSLEMARSVESIVRSTGSIPATIALIGGRVKIGLSDSELARLADQGANPGAVKLSRRDIAAAIALKKDGGTTCSSTLIFSALAGIKVFATGGLGGVHRGGENTMDVSADLQELTRCPVGLVSAGVKSILDIGRTLEYLETLGVPVLSYAETNDFPAFYTRKSGFKSPWHVSDPITAAKILQTHRQLGMSNGALFAVPIPEQYEAIGVTLQDAVEQAVSESEELGISTRGKEVTPWLLKRVGELTQGKSLASNVALVENTALVGGQIAMEYSKLALGASSQIDQHHPFVSHIGPKSNIEARAATTGQQLAAANTIEHNAKGVPQQLASLIVVGCAAVDITSQPQVKAGSDSKLGLHSTSPGKVSVSLGGVGRNIAEAAHRILKSRAPHLPSAAMLVAPISDDPFGHLLVNETRSLGMRTDGFMRRDGRRSPVCSLLLDGTGGLTGGVADMDLIQSLEGDAILSILRDHKPKMLAVDANLSPETLTLVVDHCLQENIDVFFEPTSVTKSTVILPAIAASLGSSVKSPIKFASPNLLELAQMYHEARSSHTDLMAQEHWWQIMDSFGIGTQFRMDLERMARRNVSEHNSALGTLSFLIDKGVAQMAINLLPFFQHLVIKCGEQGVVVAMRMNESESSWKAERSNPHDRYAVSRSPSSGELVVLQHFPALQLPEGTQVNVTGAGDSLVGSLLATLVEHPKDFENPIRLKEMIDRAQQAAILTLQSSYAVSPLLSSEQRP
ncbi:Indigoidine synthase A like protein-domain-containing protein [Hygrophoropsis aurantiaca]|uniref:Indigoidine synthase A like protein-domain-containing protein n=1 Tax=Hygrophoropsis aurantiaca TaxID=72124 RepID=A0ACB8ATL2_9AGAM|nr:Indigoidine synthase A like protein-domain-containing protein [Hygrophoropsis aurantiaca]